MSVDDKTATATLVRGFNKRVGRTKEIVLQSMGKVDRTEDGTFDFYVSNFSKQQANATKLQKYMGNYITTVRSMVHASLAFQDALKEVYEDEWAGKFDLINDLDHIKRCSHDYLRELDKSSTALYSYQAQFPDTRGKIDKRNRKLVDYDATRHTIEQLKNSKKRDDQKLKLEKLKAEEKNADAKRLYEHLNTELHDLLPALFDSRIVSYGSMLQSLFTAESSYHADLSKHNQGLSEVIDKLVEERGRGTYSSKRGSLNVSLNGSLPPPTPPVEPAGAAAPLLNGFDVSAPATPVPASTDLESAAPAETPAPEAAPAPAAVETPASVEVAAAPIAIADAVEAAAPVEEPAPAVAAAPAVEEPAAAPAPAAAEPAPVVEEEPAAAAAPADLGAAIAAAVNEPKAPEAEAGEDQDIYTVPTNNKAAPLPSGVLKRVLATHPYTAEDEDELSFTATDVFCVLPYEDPEEAERMNQKKKKIIIPIEDDGWYFGFVEGKPDVKGVFPANFTRPLD